MNATANNSSRLRKGFAITLLFLLGVSGVTIAYRAWDSSEEWYEGEPLEFWLRGGQPPPQYLLHTNWSPQKAKAAVRHLGANSIPVLLRKLQAVDSPLKSRLIAWAFNFHLIKTKPLSAITMNIAGYEGFKILGDAGGPAAPELVRIVDANRSLSSRCYSIGALGWVGPAATKTIPSLLKWLAHTNATIRWNTALTLGRIHAEARLVVPALIKALDDGDGWVRHDAINALSAFGPEAVPAIPALTRYSEDPLFAQQVRDALSRIAPEASDPVTVPSQRH